MRLLWIAVGGAAGTVARYLIGLAALQLTGGTWPLGTLIVNLTGSFGIGVVAAMAIEVPIPETLRLAIVTGFIGGFTTYSAFNQETLQLLRSGAVGTASGYFAATVAGAVAAGWAGLLVGRLLARSFTVA